MPRRPRLVAAIVMGLAVLLWGMASLQRIFVRERNDALASLEGRRQALEQFARRELEQILRDELAGAAFEEIEEAAKDPLVPADGLYLHLGGRQILPRATTPAPGDETPAKDLYDSLSHPERAQRVEGLSEISKPFDSAPGLAIAQGEGLDADDPFAERLALFERFRRSLDKKDMAGIQENFRAILRSRSRFVVSAVRDVPFTIALVELFLAKSRPDRGLLRQLVRDGLDESNPGLQRVLLERRGKLTKADFDFLAKKIAEVSSIIEARHDDFELAAFGVPEPAPAVPEPLERPMLVADRTWYVERIEEGRVEGIAIELPAILDAITVEMRDRGLMTGDDRIALVDPAKGPEAVSALPLRADSTEWETARAAIGRRFQLKSALGITLGCLAAGVVALALLLQARERRFLALKSDFVATVSHELRTPLAAVRLLAETLEKKVGGIPEALDYPGRIVQEVDSLTFLVENILSFNRLEKGKVTPHLAEVRLSELVDMLRVETPLRTQTPVTLSAEGTDEVVFAADPELMKLLFLNLASNACKHNKRDPVQIGIAARNGGSTLTVDFRDNGMGIADGDRERVFEDFFRGSASGGFGLGLAICRRIMHLHGGEIRVADSSAEGTRFEMAFPVKGPS